MPSPTRTMTEAAITAASATTGSFGHFLKVRFGGGDVRLTTFGTDLTFNGEVYLAVGGNFSIGTIQEDGTLAVSKLEVTFDGVDRSLLSLVFGDYYIGRTLTVWRAYLNDDGTLVDDPIPMGTFLMNGEWTYEEQHNELGPVTAYLRTTVSSRTVIGTHVKGIVTNPVSHQKHYPTDNFYKYVEQLSRGDVIYWTGIQVSRTPH